MSGSTARLSPISPRALTALNFSENMKLALYFEFKQNSTDISVVSISDGSITATAFVDEDDMTSNSATLIPTQQSVKTYADGQALALAIALG